VLPGLEVEAREDEMPHVVGTKAQPLDLTHCGHLLPKIARQQPRKETAETASRIAHVAQPKSVDQHQTMIDLE
jgi:hypothetical protein